MQNFKELPLEHSDDKGRALRPHIRSAIDQLRGLDSNTPTCAKCRHRTATHLIDTRGASPKAVCGVCASAWRTLTPQQRIEARRTW